MSEQELKRLKRSEILEIMISQTNAVKAMRAELEQTKLQLEEYKAKVSEQNDTITRLRAGIVNGPAESEEESRQMDAIYKQIEQKLHRQRARIKELEAEVASLKQDRIASISEAESMEDATIHLNMLLEDAKRATEAYGRRAASAKSDRGEFE